MSSRCSRAPDEALTLGLAHPPRPDPYEQRRATLIHPGLPQSPALKAKLDCLVLVRTASMQADPVLGSRTLAHVEQQVHPTHKCA
jgi:hypothetical protein